MRGDPNMKIFFRKKTIARHIFSYILFILASFLLILGVDRNPIRWLDFVIAFGCVFLIMVSIFMNRNSQPLMITKKRIFIPQGLETRGKAMFNDIRALDKSRIRSYDITSGVLTFRINIDEFHEVVLDKFEKSTRDRLLKHMREDLPYSSWNSS